MNRTRRERETPEKDLPESVARYLLETLWDDDATLTMAVAEVERLERRRAALLAHREGVKNALRILGYEGPELLDENETPS